METKPKILVVMLDVGGVILPVNWQTAFALFSSHNLPLNLHEQLRTVSHSKEYDSYERGEMSDEEFFNHLSALLGWKTSVEDLHRLWNACLLDTFLELKDLFPKIAKTHKLATLSNTNPMHFSSFSKQDIFQHFHYLLTSVSLKARKPEIEIYHRAVKTIGCEPNQILFIDDLLVNVDSARTAGINAEQSVNSPERVIEILKLYKII